MFAIITLIVLSVLIGASYYLSYRLYQGLVTFFTGLRFWHVALVIAAAVLLLMFGFGRGFIPFSKNTKHVIGLVGAYCMGVLFYLLLFTALADLLLLVPRLIKLPFTSHHLFHGIVGIAVLLSTGITCVYGFVNAAQIDRVSYEVSVSGKKDISDINIVMISDLHLGAIGSEARLEKIVAEINEQKPDLVCIAGDFFDTDFNTIRDPDAALKTLGKLRSTFGVYTCLGNHDGGKTHPQMLEFLRQADIRLLDDTAAVIDNRLVLVGRLDSSSIGGYGDKKRKALSEFLAVDDPTMPVIVLDHNPANALSYGAEADLILCGHTHRGQVFPGSLLTNAMYTVDYGYYRKDSDSPHIIVSSGVGTWGMPMRVGTNCEIVSISVSCNK
ncbi:MAG: metallophosphoesterase [Clostridia bacterium]|nr:metallophosphoesterase [Clostridia bacterium]